MRLGQTSPQALFTGPGLSGATIVGPEHTKSTKPALGVGMRGASWRTRVSGVLGRLEEDLEAPPPPTSPEPASSGER
jgi:hypothetical protein